MTSKIDEKSINELNKVNFLDFLGIKDKEVLNKIQVNNMCVCNFKDVKDDIWYFLTIDQDTLNNMKFEIITVKISKLNDDEDKSFAIALYEGLKSIILNSKLDEDGKWYWCNTNLFYDLTQGTVLLKILTKFNEEEKDGIFYKLISFANETFTPEVIDESVKEK